MKNFDRHLILASKSPRRQQLLREAGFEFTIETKDTDESFPEELDANDVAAYISKKKADAFAEIPADTILITSDTVVKVDDKILGKPADRDEAIAMIQSMSNRSHEVITGVTLKSDSNQVTFSNTTIVHFKELTQGEIEYYVDEYQPYDKAGAYGIQEWIGMIAITKIEGSYFNVVGLPVDEVYKELQRF